MAAYICARLSASSLAVAAGRAAIASAAARSSSSFARGMVRNMSSLPLVLFSPRHDSRETPPGLIAAQGLRPAPNSLIELACGPMGPSAEARVTCTTVPTLMASKPSAATTSRVK